jgi:hypothetical protein
MRPLLLVASMLTLFANSVFADSTVTPNIIRGDILRDDSMFLSYRICTIRSYENSTSSTELNLLPTNLTLDAARTKVKKMQQEDSKIQLKHCIITTYKDGSELIQIIRSK